MSPFKRMVMLGGMSLVASAAISSGVQAQSLCTGTLRASMVHPLPKPLVVGTERSLQDTANPELAQRFANGLQNAGVTLGDGGNATLSMAVSVVASASGTSVTSGTYKGFEWMSGKPVGTAGAAPGLRSAALSISVIVTDNVAIAQAWIATVDCRVQTDDPGALAEFLGNMIGRTMGQNIDRKAV
jgi:hypothetical protein